MKNKIVITGAAGFLGGRAAKYFAAQLSGSTVVATSRRTLRARELENSGCRFVPGDLEDEAFCDELTKETHIVVHCAALSSPYGPYQGFYRSNFKATENLLQASIRNGVKKFIFISTPSIYFNFAERFNVKESEALPEKMVNYYARTKLMAEELVLGHNGNGIETIALRPRAIIGAEDTVIFPRILEAYYRGKLKIVGKGTNICDFTCVRNVIEAISCCITANTEASGQAYNITDGNPTPFWEALNYALVSLNLNPVVKKVPKGLAMFAAGIIERKALLFKEKKEPALTRYGIGILSDSFTLDISRAREKLNYNPVMSTYDGINEYIEWHRKTK